VDVGHWMSVKRLSWLNTGTDKTEVIWARSRRGCISLGLIKGRAMTCSSWAHNLCQAQQFLCTLSLSEYGTEKTIKDV